MHLFNWNNFGFRQEEVYKQGHNDDESTEEEEEAELHMAKHGKKTLPNNEGECHVEHHSHGSPSGMSL